MEQKTDHPRRGPTRKVKLTAGKNFVVEYAVPTAVRNAVEGRWIGGESDTRKRKSRERERAHSVWFWFT